jgi:hypothetical protein
VRYGKEAIRAARELWIKQLEAGLRKEGLTVKEETANYLYNRVMDINTAKCYCQTMYILGEDF